MRPMRIALVVIALGAMGCKSAEQQAYEQRKAQYDGTNRADNEHAMKQFPNAGISAEMSPAERSQRIADEANRRIKNINNIRPPTPGDHADTARYLDDVQKATAGR